MNIVNAYLEVGSYRGAAAICGTTHKTVRRVMLAWRRGDLGRARPRQRRRRNTDVAAELVAERAASTPGGPDEARTPSSTFAGQSEVHDNRAMVA